MYILKGNATYVKHVILVPQDSSVSVRENEREGPSDLWGCLIGNERDNYFGIGITDVDS